MKPERAKEIISKGWKWANFDSHMTGDEVKEVHEVWKHMPGWTSFYDALNRIAHGEEG